MKNKQTTRKTMSFHFSRQHFNSLLTALFLCASLSFATADTPSVQIEMSDSSVTLSWNDTGADSYNIYMNSEFLNSTTDTTFSVSLNSGTNLFYITSITVGEAPIVAAPSYSYTTFEGNTSYGISSSELFTNAGTMSAIDSISGAGWTFANDSLQATEFYMGTDLDTLLFHTVCGDAELVVDRDISNVFNVSIFWGKVAYGIPQPVDGGFVPLSDSTGFLENLVVNENGEVFFRPPHSGWFNLDINDLEGVLTARCVVTNTDSTELNFQPWAYGLEVLNPNVEYHRNNINPYWFFDGEDSTNTDDNFDALLYNINIRRDWLETVMPFSLRLPDKNAHFKSYGIGGTQSIELVDEIQGETTELMNSMPLMDFSYEPTITPTGLPALTVHITNSGPAWTGTEILGCIDFIRILLNEDETTTATRTEFASAINGETGELYSACNENYTSKLFTFTTPCPDEELDTFTNEYLSSKLINSLGNGLVQLIPENITLINHSEFDQYAWNEQGTGGSYIPGELMLEIQKNDPDLITQAYNALPQEGSRILHQYLFGNEFQNFLEENNKMHLLVHEKVIAPEEDKERLLEEMRTFRAELHIETSKKISSGL